MKVFLNAHNFRLEDIKEKTGFERNKAIIDAKEAVNQNDEARKRFEIICRVVFKKFKSCLTINGVNSFRHSYDAINIIYKSLQEDVEKADISEIIRELHNIINDSVEASKVNEKYEDRLYDISKIDFERLKKEFEKSPAKNTTVQSLKEIIDKRLQKMFLLKGLNLVNHFCKADSQTLI